jgi:hypothetical protein
MSARSKARFFEFSGDQLILKPPPSSGWWGAGGSSHYLATGQMSGEGAISAVPACSDMMFLSLHGGRYEESTVAGLVFLFVLLLGLNSIALAQRDAQLFTRHDYE